MRTIDLPAAELSASQLVLGLMRIADKTDQQIRELYDRARTAGVDFLDHADIYGGAPHTCERRFAEAVKLTGAEREEVLIQSKVGIVTDGPFYDFSYEHIVTEVEESLRALQTEYLDILLLHRPDPLVEPAEVARAFDALQAAGKVRHFGVSNHTVGQIELLRTAVTQPLVVNQMQLSLVHAPILTEGAQANTLDGAGAVTPAGADIVEYCRRHAITLQAWSPYQSPSGVFLQNPDYPELNAVLDRLAQRHGVTPTGIATAWLTRHPADIQVVLGTTQGARVEEAAAGSKVRLSRREWYELLVAAGHRLP
ncbi:aldo/keto reductase [Nesterenkonia sp. E16_7]|uniref:aldo/keto reductase n=1 Tax=unclassified Nesterenkonia TaxID=2629769 RepID=UPI001A911313|nr:MULTISPECIES: aldo/keto reductase [unclassified Nesterenkonia]MBO0594811.1 aldo/keto reductase [Nesterenkonia sp. E16_10]MBO0597060.1 aldo/keto reductase [Nesterenkonia sp. E16_7]